MGWTSTSIGLLCYLFVCVFFLYHYCFLSGYEGMWIGGSRNGRRCSLFSDFAYVSSWVHVCLFVCFFFLLFRFFLLLRRGGDILQVSALGIIRGTFMDYDELRGWSLVCSRINYRFSYKIKHGAYCQSVYTIENKGIYCITSFYNPLHLIVFLSLVQWERSRNYRSLADLCDLFIIDFDSFSH